MEGGRRGKRRNSCHNTKNNVRTQAGAIMDFVIKIADDGDLPQVLTVYAIAREFMRKTGNGTQWGENYPTKDILYNDILNRRLYAVQDAGGVIRGVFVLAIGSEPTYSKIDGRWLSNGTYGTIHRIASDGSTGGIFCTALSFCKGKINHLRIDTHANNMIMQHLIKKSGFTKCGTIYLQDGTARIAYELLATDHTMGSDI